MTTNQSFDWGRIIKITAEVLKIIAEKGFGVESAINQVSAKYDLSEEEKERVRERVEEKI